MSGGDDSTIGRQGEGIARGRTGGGLLEQVRVFLLEQVGNTQRETDEAV